MASKIPMYERQFFPSGNMPVARATTSVSPNSPVAAALGNLAQAAGQVSGAALQVEHADAVKAREKQENAAAVQVSNVLSEADVYWQQNTTERFKAYTVDQGDMRPAIGQDFDKWAAEQVEKLPTEKSKQYFLTHAGQMKAKLQQGAFAFQEKAVTNKLNAESAAGEQADENIVFNDATRFDEVFKRRVEPMIARTDIDEATKIKMADQYKRKLSLAVERGEMERDPAGWYRRRFGTFDPGVGGNGGVAGASVTPGSRIIADAIYGQESSSGAADTSKVNSQNVTGPMQMQEATFEGMKAKGLIPRDYDWRNPVHNKEAGYKWVEYLGNKYNGDVDKVAAAYYGGEGAVNPDGSINRYWRNKQRPGDPTVGEYIDQVKARISGAGQRAPAAPVDAAAAPVATDDKPIQPKTFTGMDWEQQLQLKNMAETRLKQAEATFKAEADRTVRDAVAMHNDGLVDSFNLKREYFDRAYGADGERMFGEYVKSREMGEDIGRFKTQSEAEIRGELEFDRPAPGRGYATQDERYTRRVQAAQRVLEMREKDPAGYVVANSRELTEQRRAIDALPADQAAQRPAMVQRFVRDSLAEQQRLGIAKPQILTPGQADAIADAASKAAKPDDAARLVAGLEAEYGEFFPRVFDQLVRDEKISAELLVIPNLPSQAARESVSRLARIKEADLQAGIDAPAIKDVKDGVTDRLGDFVRSIPYGTAQAARMTNSYETVIRKRAYELVQSGTKPADAVEQAFGQVLGHYEFRGSVRYPKGADVSTLEKGAAEALRKGLDGIDMPVDLTGARRPEDARAEWVRTIQARPLWHTRDDDGGVDLYAMGANGTKYRVTRGGKPVTFSWGDLKQLTAAPAVSSEDALARGDMRTYERQRAEEKRLRVQRENEAAAAMRIR